MTSHCRLCTTWSKVRTTTGPADTRRSSASPAVGSDQWWTVRTAMAPPNAPAGNGRCSAVARTTGAVPGDRWPIMAADGSTATTTRSAGS